ncbi:MAG TPA: choline/ethanolamine kinase family protein [Streptosporangiaceae bacterium]|nr:choline/ethanolamine kinase family protein [Streptosporangiaceae bacterium]
MDADTGAGLDEIFDQVPSIATGRLSVTELPGGLTNRNFKISMEKATYVVRVASPGSELLAIDREHEYRNSRRAAAAGVGAPVIEYAPGVGVLVIGFIEGATLTNADVADPANLKRIALACKALHGAERFDGDFNMFEIQRRYRAIAADRGFKIPDGYDELAGAFGAAEQALARSAANIGAANIGAANIGAANIGGDGTVPCNNDLLAANFIDDGDKIWLIDYEYSGNNDACFELGNIWAESHLSDDALVELVSEYYGRPLRNKIARARLLGLVGKYGWTLWGAIQAAASPIDFDFWAWGMERFDGAVEGFTGPSFGKLLDEVQRDD